MVSKFNSLGELIVPDEKSLADFWDKYSGKLVLDDEGRPQVYFHGTNANFNKLAIMERPDTKGTGIFLTSDREVAATYGENIHKVYVQIDPDRVAEIDYAGRNWNNGPAEYLVEYEEGEFAYYNNFEDALKHAEQEGVYPLTYPLELTIDGKLEPSDEPKTSDDFGLETIEYVQQARVLGFSTIKFNNVIDNHVTNKKVSGVTSDVICVLNPENIIEIGMVQEMVQYDHKENDIMSMTIAERIAERKERVRIEVEKRLKQVNQANIEENQKKEPENSKPLTYEEKKAKRIAYYRNLSANLEKQSLEKAKSAVEEVTQTLYGGQPTIIGHYSQKKSERFHDKIDKRMNSSLKLAEKSEFYKEKAEAALNSNVISSYDPDATKKINEKIESLKTIDKKSQANYAEIRRLQKRLETLEKNKQRKTATYEYNGFKLQTNSEDNKIYFSFKEKPNFEMSNSLKKHGFKWTPSKESWGRMWTGDAVFSAKEVRKELREIIQNKTPMLASKDKKDLSNIFHDQDTNQLKGEFLINNKSTLVDLEKTTKNKNELYFAKTDTHIIMVLPDNKKPDELQVIINELHQDMKSSKVINLLPNEKMKELGDKGVLVQKINQDLKMNLNLKNKEVSKSKNTGIEI